MISGKKIRKAIKRSQEKNCKIYQMILGEKLQNMSSNRGNKKQISSISWKKKKKSQTLSNANRKK